MKLRTSRAVALAVAAVALTPAGAQAATLYVEDDDGGSTCPVNEFYFGIQDAVDAAAPGDTIRICPGTYAGNVQVFKAGLTILGPQAGVDPATRPVGGGPGEAVVNDINGLDVFGDGTVVDGLTILGSEPGFGTGAAIGGDDAELRNTIVTGMDFGIAVEQGGWAIRNRVTGRPDSIAGIAAKGDDAQVRDNTVSNVGGYGIVVNGGADDAKVLGNRLNGNGTQPATVSGASDPADCKDFTTGTGTAGTASTWSQNTGAKTSKPAGICLVAPPASTIACPTIGPLNPLLGSPLRNIGRAIRPVDPVIRAICGVR